MRKAAIITTLARVAMVGVAVLFVMLGPRPGLTVEPDEILKNPKLEQRARKLSAELRCLVCQNQSIDDSNAPLARDLRLLVRERLSAGDSDSAVLDYIVARYGEFVLLRPPLGVHTLLLWLAPLLLLFSGIALARFAMRRRQDKDSDVEPATQPLSDEERARLKQMLDDHKP